jgi:tRNA (guanine-N7-)-methyltransferase
MLKKHNSRTLPWPTDWSQLFPAERPLVLEIGFGQGEYLLHLAQRPANIIGLEISNRCLTRVENTLERRRITHVRVIHTPAETALHHLFAPDTLTEVHINFPDPWFKARHGHRRLMQRATVDALVSRLQPGGKLFLATDISEYAAMSHELLAETPGLTNLQARPWTHHMPGRITTKYERRAHKEGRPCHYFAYERNPEPAPPVPVIKEQPMPHVVFASPLDLDIVRKRFAPRQFEYGDAHINFNGVYLGENALLFDVYVSEPTIDQRVALLLVARDQPGEFTLQLSMLGHPRPTAGIHGAAHLLSDWILSLDPANQVIKSKLQPRLETT